MCYDFIFSKKKLKYSFDKEKAPRNEYFEVLLKCSGTFPCPIKIIKLLLFPIVLKQDSGENCYA